MPLTNWPLAERPREKLLALGASSLSDTELLAIFIATGTRGKTAVDLARELLQEFKTLRKLFTSSSDQLAAIKGIGRVKYAMLQAALELAKRCIAEGLKNGSVLSSAEDARQFFIAKLSDHKREIFSCLFLNAKHEMLGYEEIFQGNVSCAPVYPRVIAQKALEYNATAIILAHNHPSGSTTPSPDDITTTKALARALSQLDITILDHLIVGGNQCISFAETGLI